MGTALDGRESGELNADGRGWGEGVDCWRLFRIQMLALFDLKKAGMATC